MDEGVKTTLKFMIELAEVKQYVAAFDRAKERVKAEPSWLRSLREEAMSHFAVTGFPVRKEEAWRYTDVSMIRDSIFECDEEAAESVPHEIDAFRKSHQGHFLFFLNGKYLKADSQAPQGVQVLDLGQASLLEPALLEKDLARHADPKQNAFISLNTALWRQGILIRFPEGLILKEPVHLVFWSSPRQDHTAFYSRVLIQMEKGSRATLAEYYRELNDKSYLTNSVSEIVLHENAELKRYKIQQESLNAFHVASTEVVQERSSRFTSLAVSLGSQWMRDECRVRLAGEGARSILNGLYLADGQQFLDHHIFVDHQVPECQGRQLFKGILVGRSHGVFSGKVLVRQDAQKTDAKQTNKNLLLSDEAKIDTQPQLEILADDVKCSHGATVGQLDEDSIFYLKSRGIGERKAGQMLAEGFVKELTDSVSPDLLREELNGLVAEKLERQLSDHKD